MTSATRGTRLVLGFILAFGAGPLAADLPSGLGGLKWGDPPAPDMVLTGRVPFEKPRRTRFYAKKKDATELAGVKVRSAEFVFRDDRLVAVFCAIGSPGSNPADGASLDALWGPHETGRDGSATWRGERTVAVLLRPETTGGHGPLVGLFAAPASDAEISATIRTFVLRAAGGASFYQASGSDWPPPPRDQSLNDQFQREMQPQARSNPPQK